MVGWGGQYIHTHLLQDRLENALSLKQYLTIVEAKHSDLSALEPGCPDRVTSASIIGEVLATVNLKCKPMLRAEEIEDIRSELMLSAKLRSTDLSSP